ncbi:unnamed protein product [Ilex paraguariensis]|uniref:Uncharacterized protein n=2 Tax=Ilex paraguariensis TaxID=185542 RepID=A0ABC8R0L9_9AQUA
MLQLNDRREKVEKEKRGRPFRLRRHIKESVLFLSPAKGRQRSVLTAQASLKRPSIEAVKTFVSGGSHCSGGTQAVQTQSALRLMLDATVLF